MLPNAVVTQALKISSTFCKNNIQIVNHHIFTSIDVTTTIFTSLPNAYRRHQLSYLTSLLDNAKTIKFEHKPKTYQITISKITKVRNNAMINIHYSI